ncbi:unnamed protein product [Closterium sp. NIES-53]
MENIEGYPCPQQQSDGGGARATTPCGEDQRGLPCRCGNSRSNSSGSGSNTGGRSCSSGGFSCGACSNLHSGALTDMGSTHTGTSEVLSVGAAATTRLVPAFVAGSGATSPTARLSFTLEFGSSSCYYTPSFSRNLVGVSHLHDLGVVTTFSLHGPVASCTVGATGAPLATFHREPGSGLYSLHTRSHHTGSGQVRSGQVAAVSCDCRSLTHPSVLWHHRLGHPLFPRLSRMRAAPHSSLLPPTTAPLQTLHLDVWGLSPVLGPRQEHYFLIVVDDYSCYTTVFPLRWKADLPTVLEPWLLAKGGVQGLCGLHLHSDHGGEFSSTRLETFSPPPVAPVAPPPSRPAPSGVSHVTSQSSPLQRLVPVVFGGAGGAVAEGEGTGAAGARRASSGGAGGVRVEITPEEDMAVSTYSPPRPVAAELGGVPARGIGVLGGVVGGGSGSRGAGAGDTNTVTPTLRTVRFLTRLQRLDRLEREERERFERAQQQQSQSEFQERVEEESRQQQQQQQSQSERQERVDESRQQQQQQQPWLTRDAAARLAIRNHLPLAECAHFGQHRTAQALYDAVIARYSLPATAALGRLLLPYLFPELSAFAKVEDLVSHLRTSDTRYRAVALAEFINTNQPAMFITLYFIITRLLDSLHSLRDHFLSLGSTVLTIDLLEQHLLAAETSVVALGAAQGTPRKPFFEGCSPSPLAPSYASAAAVDVPGAEDVGAAFASAKCRSSKGKGGRGEGGGSGGGGGGSSGGGGGSGGGGSDGSGGGSGGFDGGGGGSGGSSGSGSGGSGGGRTGAQRGGFGGGQRGSGSGPYVIRTGDRAGQTCRKPHTQHRCFSCLDDTWCAEFGDKVERPHWAELLRSGVAIFELEYDAILSAMYALFVSTQGDCYLCVLPDPGIEAATLGASESSLPSTAPPSLLSLHLSQSDWLTPPAAQTLPIPPLFSHVQQFRPAHCQDITSPRSVRNCLPKSLPPFPPTPAPPCLPCVEEWQRATPHSSSFPPKTAPLQTLHIDVKGEVVDVLIPWIRTIRLQLGERFSQVLPVLRVHFDRAASHWLSHGGRSYLNDPCGCSPFSVVVCGPVHCASAEPLAPCLLAGDLTYTALDRKVGDASVFRVWGSRAFVRDPSEDKLSARAIPCVFLDFPPDAPGWLFYHPTSRCVLPYQDVTFDKLVPFYRLFPYRSAPPRPPPLFIAPNPPPVDPLPPQGLAPSCVSQVDPLPSAVPVEVASDSGAARGAAFGGVGPGGAEPWGAEFEGAESRGAEPEGSEPTGVERGCVEPEGVKPGGAESEGAETGGAEPRGAALFESPASASPRLSPRPEPLSPHQLRESLVRRARLWSGAAGAGATGDTGAGGVGVAARAGGTGVAAAAGLGGARTRNIGAAGTGGVGGAGAGDPTGPGAVGAGGAGAESTGAGGAGAGGAGAGGNGAGGAGDRGAESSTGFTPPLLYPPPDQLQPPLQPASPLPAPSPHSKQTDGLTENREPASHPASPVRTCRRVPRPRPPPVPGTHAMALCPSFVPLCVPLPASPESSLPAVPNTESGHARAASPTVSRLLDTVVTDPSFESSAASTLAPELVEVAAACRLDYATALVAESDSASPPFVGGECALGTDVLEDRQEDFECLAAAVPRFTSMLLAPEGDAGVKQPPGSPPAFKARYVARGFSQRQGVDYFQNFSPTPKITTLWVLVHVSAQCDYELHSLDLSTAFLQGSLHEEIWLRRPPGFTGSFPAGTHWSLRWLVYGLRQAPREWHDTLRTTLAALGFTPSIVDSSLFLRTDTSPPPLYVFVYVDDLVFATVDTEALTLVNSELHKITPALTRPTPLSTSHSLSAPPSDESVEPSAPFPGLVGCLMYLMTCTRANLAYPLSLLARYVAPGRHRKVHWDATKRVLHYLCSTPGMGLVLGGRGPVVLTAHADASWVDDSATQRSSQGYTFSLGTNSFSWRSTRSSSVLSSSCVAEIYAGAMAAQELCRLTYVLNFLEEQPRSPPVLYVDNKVMIALYQVHRLEHRTKHISLRYFLARELQQRGQLRLAYVAIRANTTDIFTKALPPCAHQHFSTVLGLVPTLPHLLFA